MSINLPLYIKLQFVHVRQELIKISLLYLTVKILENDFDRSLSY